jgi:hypothetical protein
MCAFSPVLWDPRERDKMIDPSRIATPIRDPAIQWSAAHRCPIAAIWAEPEPLRDDPKNATLGGFPIANLP